MEFSSRDVIKYSRTVEILETDWSSQYYAAALIDASVRSCNLSPRSLSTRLKRPTFSVRLALYRTGLFEYNQ